MPVKGSTVRVQHAKLVLQSLQMENEVRELCKEPSAVEEKLPGNNSPRASQQDGGREMVIRTGCSTAN